MTPEQILADYERMLQAEWEEAFKKWSDSGERQHLHYMLGLKQAKDLMKLAKLGPPVRNDTHNTKEPQ